MTAAVGRVAAGAVAGRSASAAAPAAAAGSVSPAPAPTPAAAPKPTPTPAAAPKPAGSVSAAPSKPSPLLASGSAVDTGAGFVLGLLLWAWVALPFLRGGQAEMRKVLRAKFFNRAPDGSWLP